MSKLKGWENKDLSRLSLHEAVQLLVDQQAENVKMFQQLGNMYADQAGVLYGVAGRLCKVIIENNIATVDQLADEFETAARLNPDHPLEGLLTFAEGLRSGLPPTPPERPELTVIDGGKTLSGKIGSAE